MRVGTPTMRQAILQSRGTLPRRDLPDEWYGDLARMFENVSRDALAFVNVSGSARAPQMGPMNSTNGNGHVAEGDSQEDAQLPHLTIVAENGDEPQNGDILTNGQVSDVAAQVLVEETDDVPPP